VTQRTSSNLPQDQDGGGRTTADWAWRTALQGLQFAGECRANAVRLAAVATFYAIHLTRYAAGPSALGDGVAAAELAAGEARFHLLASLLALAWLAVAAAVHLSLQQRQPAQALSYAATAADALLLTALLNFAAGPRSPLTTGYFLIVAMAALRLNVPLVRFATAAAALGYVCVLGVARWPAAFGRDPEELLRIPRYQQAMFLAALALTGVITGQAVRLARELAVRYAQLSADAATGTARDAASEGTAP
jgi:hypothetical protein